MRQFKRVEPTIIQEVGLNYKNQVVIKNYTTEDGLRHEFTTFYPEGFRSVNVIAITKDKKVITCRQFRPGAEKWMIDAPGGKVEVGEDLEEAAKRELLEETGYVPGSMIYLGGNSVDCYINITQHVYLALDCVKDSLANLEQSEEDQGLTTELISIDELIFNAKHNHMTNGISVLKAYDYLIELNKEESNEKTN